MPSTIYRGTILSFNDEPLFNAENGFLNPESLTHFADGAIEVTAEGTIGYVGPWTEYEQSVATGSADALAESVSARIQDRRGSIIMPGFIDAHLHFPQMPVMGAHGAQLLPWLEKYIFPAEAAYQDRAHAEQRAPIFWKELWAHGTTMSAVYSSSHTASTLALLESAQKMGVRSFIGKTLMDQNGPEHLIESTEQALADTRELLKQWANGGPVSYALSPRFAVSCSENLMKGIGRLWDEHPNARLQTHISENQSEVALVKKLYPKAKSYLDVYDSAGLIRKGSLLGHGIWLEQSEWDRIKQSQAVIVHCPLSNDFLGSGIFNRPKAKSLKIRVALGSDIAAGTALCMLKTAEASCRVARQQGLIIHPLTALYDITLGNARALGVDATMGSLSSGQEANLLFLDPRAVPMSSQRLSGRSTDSLSAEELSSILVYLGDERMIREVLVAGITRI